MEGIGRNERVDTRTIAVLNQKGGVGKTTTVTNTAAALAEMGARVAVLDFDPQAHLTIHLGVEPQTVAGGSYGVLIQSAQLGDELREVRPNLWLLPANIDLVGAESELVSVVGREIVLREALETVQGQFDFCFIDCAPSLGLLTLNALAAAREVLIPLQPHFLALQGFGKLLQTVQLVNRRINPALRVTGILLCMFDTRASLPNEVKADIERFLQNARGTDSAWSEAQILPTFIRRNIKLAEAPSYGKTIFEYEPNCNGAEDYRNVAAYFAGDRFRPPVSEDASQDTTPPAGLQEEITASSCPEDSRDERPDAAWTRRDTDGEPADRSTATTPATVETTGAPPAGGPAPSPPDDPITEAFPHPAESADLPDVPGPAEPSGAPIDIHEIRPPETPPLAGESRADADSPRRVPGIRPFRLPPRRQGGHNPSPASPPPPA